jgi:hypothetical protein
VFPLKNSPEFRKLIHIHVKWSQGTIESLNNHTVNTTGITSEVHITAAI